MLVELRGRSELGFAPLGLLLLQCGIVTALVLSLCRNACQPLWKMAVIGGPIVAREIDSTRGRP